VQYKQRTPFGQIVNVRTCDVCHGEGKLLQILVKLVAAKEG